MKIVELLLHHLALECDKNNHANSQAVRYGSYQIKYAGKITLKKSGDSYGKTEGK